MVKIVRRILTTRSALLKSLQYHPWDRTVRITGNDDHVILGLDKIRLIVSMADIHSILGVSDAVILHLHGLRGLEIDVLFSSSLIQRFSQNCPKLFVKE